MLLKEILKGIRVKHIEGTLSFDVNALAFDSREIKKGDAFVALKGSAVDGHKFISVAIDHGATAIVCEDLPTDRVENVCYVMVEDSHYALGVMASNYYGNPSQELELVGVTGTNGKTTIVTLLYQLFIESGYSTGMLSTIVNRINEEDIPSTHTTPDPLQLNKLLRQMVGEGVTHCFMEVSSHAIDQDRITGLRFKGGIFTNLTHDHLDYHKTFLNYRDAKKKFFDNLSEDAFALTNVDDKNGWIMLQNSKAMKKTYSLKSMANYKARIIENQFDGLVLDIDGVETWCRLVGDYNASNLLVVYATAIELGFDKVEVLSVISALPGAEGRFDYFKSKDNVVAIVDYAHTPDAVENVLTTISSIRTGAEQIITVIGAGGDRDKTKRPRMAEAAVQQSDKVILTSDNPRSEDPEKILEDMYAGVELHERKKVLVISNRKEAIRTACALAQGGDIILVAGKGHEKYQEIKGVKHPFDDKEILMDTLKL
jgi:UDP-N-acetylmuramoyl-L-alanyl-D-glutamate--2,6-diaminopimelate ligase